MSRDAFIGLALQLFGLASAPLLVGMVNAAKARLQGRRGAPITQPYRDLRRMWRKLAVLPSGTSAVYGMVPSVVAAATAAAVLITPVGAYTSGVLGTDALLVGGLLALARFAITVSAWEPGTSFGIMGAGRDLMFAVFTEPLLILALALVALQVGSTRLTTMVTVHTSVALDSPAQACAALAFILAVFVETGRQPIDNPDTHLELTMVHEGPLLEYAGRDLALLTWSAAARHWVMLVLAFGLFLPLPHSHAAQAIIVLVALPFGCIALAVAESMVVKMRILRVPGLLGAGLGIAVIGMLAFLATAAGGAG